MHGEHELVLVEHELLQLRVAQLAAEADGDLVPLHELDHLLRVAGANGDLHAGALEREALEDRRQRVGRDGG